MSGIYDRRKIIRKSIDEVLHFLNGNYDRDPEEIWKSKMEDASEAMEFEKAIEYRELLRSVQKIAQKQKITDTAGEDRDIVAMAKNMQDAVVQVFFIRGGRLIGQRSFLSETDRRGDEERNPVQLYQTVLCRNTVYSGGTYAAGGGGRQELAGRMADRKTGT